MLRTRSPRKEKISNCYLHSNSLSNKMDNSLLDVRDINHKYIVVEEETILGIHIPSWVRPGSVQVRINGKVKDITADVENGYLILKRVWENDEVELVFPMKIRKIYANLKVREDAGCVAFMRGPMVYCFEGVDNPGLLQSYHIFEDAKMEEEVCKEGLLEGCVLLKIKARKLETVGDSLYSEVAPVRTLTTLTAVPYYTWGNRGENQMRVWMRGE